MLLQKLLWPRVGICTEDRLYYRMKAPSFRDEGQYQFPSLLVRDGLQGLECFFPQQNTFDFIGHFAILSLSLWFDKVFAPCSCRGLFYFLRPAFLPAFGPPPRISSMISRSCSRIHAATSRRQAGSRMTSCPSHPGLLS